MAWKMSGQLIESCSCNMLCPCWFGVPELALPDQGWCAGTLAFRVQQGNSDGVDLGGRTVVLVADFPGPNMFDGNGTGRIYVDDGATAEQRRELEAVFQGKKGGPMENVAALVTNWLETQPSKIDFKEEGDSIAITVGNAGVVNSRKLKDPEGNGFTLRGGGFVGGLGIEAMELAPSASRWSDGDLPRQFETKSGGRGGFSWNT